MNILHTSEFYSPGVGGEQEVVKQLSERLAARGHEVTVATTRLFDEGYRIDIQKYKNMFPSSCHQEVEFVFSKGISGHD